MALDVPGPEREALGRLLTLDRYPRTADYDPLWVIEHMMGPNPLWLAEALTAVMPLAPGMRVLDLGCGKALTSIFLAREFGVQVWAADLWIKPAENWERVQEAGLAGQVHPLSVEAHTLPFADGFFDAVVSIDAYQYFGTADLYLGYLLRFLKQGGQLGIVVPGLVEEQPVLPPPHLAGHWQWEMCCFHSPAWWQQHWEKTGLVTVEAADLVPHGWEDWMLWNQACARVGRGFPEEIPLLEADGGRLLCFSRVVATRR